jgi:hypothetical protein
MRTRNFLVPQDLIYEFVEAIEENDFSNHIVGTTAENEIEISIHYDTDQRKAVNELQDMIDEHMRTMTEMRIKFLMLLLIEHLLTAGVSFYK